MRARALLAQSPGPVGLAAALRAVRPAAALRAVRPVAVARLGAHRAARGRVPRLVPAERPVVVAQVATPAPPVTQTSNVCAPDAAVGWTGPVAFRKGAGAPPICPGNYGTKVADGNIGLIPGAASCKCSCDPAAGISCTGTAKLYDVGELITSCIGNPPGSPVWSGTSSTCSHPTASTSGKVSLIPPTPSNMGTCTAKSAHTLPTPTWTQETRICTGATPAAGTCASGNSCVPQPGAPYELCVYRPGDMACPGEYPKKSLVYEKFTDTRSCSGCSCGNATSTCAGTMSFVSSCTGLPLLYTSVSGCAIPAGGHDISTSHWAKYTPKPTGTCTESASTLTGTVTPSGEATVCCM